MGDLPGCVVIMDDILEWGSSLEEQSRNLAIVQRCIKGIGVTLNKDKSQVGKQEVRFFGHPVVATGICPSPGMQAILAMPAPINVL